MLRGKKLIFPIKIGLMENMWNSNTNTWIHMCMCTHRIIEMPGLKCCNKIMLYMAVCISDRVFGALPFDLA